jgi:hypothetical protein
MLDDEKIITKATRVKRTCREMEYMCTGRYEVRRVDAHW